MDVLRLHSCDMLVTIEGSVHEWDMMIAAGSYAEVAMLAERYIAESRPQATICEMNIQAQDATEGAPGIRFSGQPVAATQVPQGGTLPFRRWLDVLRGKSP
jgi:hypothetical protein